MKKAIIGKKVGMTQIFDESGKVIPVTVIEAGPCVVVQKKTAEKEGYASVQEAALSIRDYIYNKKYSEKMAADVAEKIKGLGTLEEVADKLGYTVSSQTGITFAAMGNGQLDPKFIGAISNAPVGVLSGPVAGSIGVYVFQVKGRDTGSFYTEDDAALYEQQKNSYNTQLLLSVMQDDAEVKDNRARFF